ncbi:MAG: GAF domain-containing protein [Erysipelotrichaceae bacterium]|nr:GAF domain-containing protein [Erysipelotrichaceae bacterium]
MKQSDYKMMCRQIRSLAEISDHYMPVLANASAILYEGMDNLNWAGFYLTEEEHLILGPFQGKFACVRIEKGKGVCGTAYETDETQVVADVHQFPGHIACDSASNSEIVIPLHSKGKVVAVMDIDSPLFDRFSKEDIEGLSEFARTLEEIIRW